PVFSALADAADLAAPIIVMCASSRETAAALEAEVFDVVRKPYEWELISRRARHASRQIAMEKQLADSRDSLTKALTLADAARQQLRSRESFEPVTGLPNKTKFIGLLKRGMHAVDRDGTKLAVFVIGFTRFRLVIEAMGQEKADNVLTQIGHNLAECLRHSGSPRREMNGLRTAAAASLDQFRFGLMLTCSNDDEELRVLHNQLLDTLSQPIQVSGQTVYLSACLGVALYPQDADDADSLLQRADNAMRDAQSRGGGFKYYCAETDAAAARKLRIENMLHEALDRDDLKLVYQPITAMDGSHVVAAEALLRWPQEDGSFIPPTEFVPIAEESGLMIRIGAYVLDEACRQLKAWHRVGIALPHICVNVAKVQLISAGFADSIKRILERHDLDPACLELEISERGVLSGDYDVISQLVEIKKLGIRLSVDDFGTGDSAIAYLKDLPIDVLKIDQSYVAGLTVNHKDEAITSAMVALGQRLNLEVIAEGVETAEQLSILKKLGCDTFQGFLVSKAVAADAFAALLKMPATP
ncbi:MAG: bifunctional diguanylate cyclase/phosphodiesterase, partial [Gammaproteobacteria bacterium]|nr:bifunctional diguanylate cyclase/phosphodiesterase [Gammaproteobacteria bacterium]